jgi:hypothetical protein
MRRWRDISGVATTTLPALALCRQHPLPCASKRLLPQVKAGSHLDDQVGVAGDYNPVGMQPPAQAKPAKAAADLAAKRPKPFIGIRAAA